ncbi:MAG TPA: hypothetical protein VLH41_04295, partial [Thermoanaerobaculia bacterium]|nr:hypothetical protein [Thermoanaerobaculia bacterium]
MDKKHRHDLQKNPLKEALLDARDYLTSHKGQTTRTVVIVVAAAVVIGAVWGGIALRNRRLTARFSEAIALFDAPLASDGAVPQGARVFK